MRASCCPCLVSCVRREHTPVLPWPLLPPMCHQTRGEKEGGRECNEVIYTYYNILYIYIYIYSFLCRCGVFSYM